MTVTPQTTKYFAAAVCGLTLLPSCYSGAWVGRVERFKFSGRPPTSRIVVYPSGGLTPERLSVQVIDRISKVAELIGPPDASAWFVAVPENHYEHTVDEVIVFFTSPHQTSRIRRGEFLALKLAQLGNYEDQMATQSRRQVASVSTQQWIQVSPPHDPFGPKLKVPRDLPGPPPTNIGDEEIVRIVDVAWQRLRELRLHPRPPIAFSEPATGRIRVTIGRWGGISADFECSGSICELLDPYRSDG